MATIIPGRPRELVKPVVPTPIQGGAKPIAVGMDGKVGGTPRGGTLPPATTNTLPRNPDPAGGRGVIGPQPGGGVGPHPGGGVGPLPGGSPPILAPGNPLVTGDKFKKGGKGGVKEGGGGMGAAEGGSTNKAQMNPELMKQIKRYEDRLSSDTTDRAVQKSTLDIQDAAALSAADAKGILAARGTLGSGAGSTFLAKKIFQPAQRQAADAAAKIRLGREGQLDQLVLGGSGIVGAPGQMNLADRQLALGQQGQTWQQNFAQSQAEEASNLAQTRAMMDLYQRELAGAPVAPGTPLPGGGSVGSTPYNPLGLATRGSSVSKAAPGGFSLGR